MPADERTYTFSGDPTTDTKDAVRVLLADINTDGVGWMLADEDIFFAIDQAGSNPMFVAAFCAEFLIAPKFTGPTRSVIEKRIGDLQISGPRTQTAAETWQGYAKALRRGLARQVPMVAGGIDAADKVVDDLDTTLNQPAFKRGQFDAPMTTDPDDSPSAQWAQ